MRCFKKYSKCSCAMSSFLEINFCTYCPNAEQNPSLVNNITSYGNLQDVLLPYKIITAGDSDNCETAVY